MVQELRQIILSKEELIPALDAHNRVTPRFLPVGEIVRYEVVDHNSVSVTVQITPCAQEVSMTIDKGQLLQPLIRFCLENNIMLPREGQKSVAIEGDKVSLCIALNIDDIIETLIFDRMEVCAESAQI